MASGAKGALPIGENRQVFIDGRFVEDCPPVLSFDQQDPEYCDPVPSLCTRK